MVSYIKFDWAVHDALVPSFIQAYRHIFGGEPYEEWDFCPNCNSVWGIDQHLGKVRVSTQLPVIDYQPREDRVASVSHDVMVCGYCNVALLSFWPEERVYADLQKQLTPESSCWLALDGDEVAGFCWGYPIHLQTLEEELGLPVYSPLRAFSGHAEILTYLDEMGVRKAYRQRGIAGELLRRHLGDLDPNLPGILRTQLNSVAYYWYLKLGYTEITRYTNWDRVILAVRNVASLFS